MSDSKLWSTTWRRKSGLASWTFCFSEAADVAPFRRVLAAVVGALGSFGRPVDASWTSASTGDGAAEQDLGAEPVAALLSVPLADPVQVSLTLELVVALPDGTTETLPAGADLWLDREDGETVVVLSLDVDLYAWRSWGEQRDNAALAALNAPRLAGFLSRLVAIGAELNDIDAESYPGQVSATGFEPV